MQGGVISMLVADRCWLTIWHSDWSDDTLLGLVSEVTGQVWAAKTYNRGDSGLPCCTRDRSGKLDDCQPLKAAVAEVFSSMMLTHLQARSPNPMLDMQHPGAAQAVICLAEIPKKPCSQAGLFAVGTPPPPNGTTHCRQSTDQAQKRSEWGPAHAEGQAQSG